MRQTLYQYALKNVSAVDGDTLKADIDLGFGVSLTAKKIRLEHINCPEKNTPEGVAAKEFTKTWVDNAAELVVNVKNHREDKYGRILGTVTHYGESLADILKFKGHGVDYEGGKR